MPHSRSLSEQSCLLANVDFTSHEDDRFSRRGSLSPYTFPSHHVVHVYPDPEFSLPSSSQQQKDEPISWSDLPNKRQLLILSLCRLSSQLSNLFILPYVFHLVRSAVSASSTPTLTEDNDDIVTYYMSIPTTALVSTYSGVLVACFPLAQLLVSLLPFKNHDGRLPIIWSMAVLATANVAFGFSRSFWALLFWRVVSGLAAGGNGEVVRKMAGEVVGEEKKKYRDKASQVLSMVGNVGLMVGLAMGGILAEPVKTMPGLFGFKGVLNWSGSEKGVKWMVQYPFALPAVMCALLIGVVAAIAALWLTETRSGSGYLTQRPYILLNNSSTILSSPHDDDDDEKATPKHSLSAALTARTIPPLISSFLLTLHTSAFTFLLALHLSTPSSPYSPLQSTSHSLVSILFRFTGGLSLPPLTISLYLSSFGLIGLLLRGYIYPRWQKRLSSMGLFELSLAVFPFVYLLSPYLSLFPWGHQDTTKGYDEIMKWIALGLVLGAQTLAVTMAVPSAEELLAESASSKEEGLRERVKELGQLVTKLASVVGPVVGGVVYAKGVREGVVGAAWWFYLVVVAVVAAAWCVGVQGRGYEEHQDEEKR